MGPKKLLVLDLDETLVYASLQPLARPADFRADSYFVYERPFLAELLAACQGWFEVAVWTSASPAYAAAVVEAVFPQAPSFVWASDRCSETVDWETGERFGAKNLKKIKQRGYPLGAVIVVDDSPEKHRRNYGNLVRVVPFLGDEADQELRLLRSYLDALRTVDDVRAVEKRRWRSQVLRP